MLSQPADGLRRYVNVCPPFMEPADEAPLAEQQGVSAAQFAAGRLVRICGGAFTGFEGVVLRRCGFSRLIVALALSQSGVYLEIEAEMLEAID
jgi:hypothetical protein